MPRVLVETCVDSIDKAERALRGGTDRLEVCSRLEHGGFTPSETLLDGVLELRERLYPSCRVFAMVRPWLDGKTDFVYEKGEERHALFDDLRAVTSKAVDGIVVGALCRGVDGRTDVDDEVLTGICLVADRMDIQDITFHRAFDEIDGNRLLSIGLLAKYGKITRILTSGGVGQAARVSHGDHVEKLRTYRLCAKRHNICILPGSGLSTENVRDVVEMTGCREVHGSFDDGGSVEEVIKLLQGL